MGQVITFSRQERLRLKLKGFSRACHPVVVETTTGLHPCARIVCHDRVVELKTELGEIELFRYDHIIDVTPMMSLAQIANKANISIVEEVSTCGKVLPFPGSGLN